MWIGTALTRARRWSSCQITEASCISILLNGMAMPTWRSRKKVRSKDPPEFACLVKHQVDVALTLRNEYDWQGRICIVMEVARFREDGRLCPMSSETSQEQFFLRTDILEKIALAEKLLGPDSGGCQGTMTDQQEPYVLYCRDVLILRQGADEGYEFLEKPVRVDVVVMAIGSNRPTIRTSLQDGSEWYAEEEHQHMLVERLELIFSSAIAEENRSKEHFGRRPEGKNCGVAVALPAIGIEWPSRHPIEAVATTFKHARRAFGANFERVFVCCPNTHVAVRILEIVSNVGVLDDEAAARKEREGGKQAFGAERQGKANTSLDVLASAVRMQVPQRVQEADERAKNGFKGAKASVRHLGPDDGAVDDDDGLGKVDSDVADMRDALREGARRSIMATAKPDNDETTNDIGMGGKVMAFERETQQTGAPQRRRQSITDLSTGRLRNANEEPKPKQKKPQRDTVTSLGGDIRSRLKQIERPAVSFRTAMLFSETFKPMGEKLTALKKVEEEEAISREKQAIKDAAADLQRMIREAPPSPEPGRLTPVCYWESQLVGDIQTSKLAKADALAAAGELDGRVVDNPF
mmetsp:Transcript_20803/g.46398  ORF Transcript_20803/g.46398 Transcript_20803/m.46398 type:complete len:580 (+) Transcript_20803:583-2322(+)